MVAPPWEDIAHDSITNLAFSDWLSWTIAHQIFKVGEVKQKWCSQDPTAL